MDADNRRTSNRSVILSNEEVGPTYRFLAQDNARQVAAFAKLMADTYSYAASQLNDAAETIMTNSQSEDSDTYLRFVYSFVLNAVIPHMFINHGVHLTELLHYAQKAVEYAHKIKEEKKNDS